MNLKEDKASRGSQENRVEKEQAVIFMEEKAEKRMTVNGRTFQVLRLLGKGGYSYLVEDESGRYVLKQIHHEPCDYYQFGNKLESEIRDYQKLKGIGIRMPKLLETDTVQERILKE